MNLAVNRLPALPAPTKSLTQAKADLDEYGLCILAELLTPEQVAHMRQLILSELEADEARGELAVRDWIGDSDDKSRRLWRLPNRHKVFCDLVEHPVSLEMMRYLLGDFMLLSSSSANVPAPGNVRMMMHADQNFTITPVREVSLVATSAWMIDAFTPSNGATCVVPRSHLRKRNPEYPHEGEDEAIPVTGPAGSLLILDGRLWHQTGSNQTQKDRVAIFNYYSRSWVRTVENWQLHLSPQVLSEASPTLRQLFGYDGNPLLPGGDRRRA
jgi:ectoine hydroxylase-related dioxygenase (phytanoyl-CoA dioxygenase family)